MQKRGDNMIYIRVNELLKQKKKSKYWLVKHMGSGYQAVSNLMNNETTGIKFETLEKMCEILECDPGDIIVIKNTTRRKRKNEQTTKAV
jgi:putative transcriptional regulator